MKKSTLSKVADGGVFKLSKRSKVEYKRIISEKGGIVFTSLSSEMSFKRPGKTVVYLLH